MNIIITINVNNDSFNNPNEVERVLAQAVKRLAHRGYEQPHDFNLIDSNGNTVGECKVVEDSKQSYNPTVYRYTTVAR